MKNILLILIFCILPFSVNSQSKSVEKPEKKTESPVPVSDNNKTKVINNSQINKLRIGVFDSRLIAIAYYQGDEGKNEANALVAALEKAKTDNDTVSMKKLQEKLILFPKIANEQGLGRGSVAYILEKYKKELSELIKNKNIIMMVSKWELFGISKAVDYIDVTDEILKIFKPNDTVKELLKKIAAQKPIEDAMFIEIPNQNK